jgi:hypothetical protein
MKHLADNLAAWPRLMRAKTAAVGTIDSPLMPVIQHASMVPPHDLYRCAFKGATSRL